MSIVYPKTGINLSSEARDILYIAARKAEEHLHTAYGAAHMLWALLDKQFSIHPLIQKWGKDIFYMQEWAAVRLEEYPKANGGVTKAKTDPGVQDLLMEADQLRFKLGREEVDAVCLLAALCTPGLAFSYDQLKTFSLSPKEILSGVNQTEVPVKTGEGKLLAPDVGNTVSTGAGPLNTYCLDKHKEVTGQGGFQLIERQEEIKSCLEVLSRYAKTNLIITGEPGVGKSALITGLAGQIEEENVPDNLLKARLLELDLAALQAGVRYERELEDRFQQTLRALRTREKSILVVEDIHTLLDKNNNTASLANLLTLELDRNNITVIGTTTPEDFRKTIERDRRFIRRFEIVALDEPDDEAARQIIKSVIVPHGRHHGLDVTEAGIKEAIRLSRRYDKDRRLPDAAIDLIDRCMARVRITTDRSQTAFKQLQKVFKQYKGQEWEEAAGLSIVREQYSTFHELSNRFIRDHYAFSLEEEETLNGDAHFAGYLARILPRVEEVFKDPPKEINSADLAQIISRKTGIPTGNVQTRERKRLLGMKEALRKRVVGQDAALKSVTGAVLESRSGLLKDGQPTGSFFLLGPTGTGKTELAKALSEFLFQDERAMIRFDMSEFKEEHSAALLHGAPPGYVGYDEGGMLVNKIRAHPYSVVLFDEIEKAHASVYDIFLQILDEGRLSDRLGKEGDFSNSVILFTSNVGSEHITTVYEKENRLPSSRALVEILSGYFRPEFLGRLTGIVPFAPIDRKALLRILEINMNDLLKAARRKGISVEVDAKTKEYLARLGYSPEYGARPLKGIIREKVRKPLSRLIIEERVVSGDQVQLSLDMDEHIHWKINQTEML